MVVACAAGSGADTSFLTQITENVVSLDTADSQSIAKFFAWVTASIGVTSAKVEDAGKEATGLNELPPPPSELNIILNSKCVLAKTLYPKLHNQKIYIFYKNRLILV